ncbi:MAG: sodium/proline symporter [Planctomycetota bacterium]
MSWDDPTLLTLIAYKLVLLGIGLWANRRIDDGSDFLLGGRGLGPMVAAISASASSSSVWTLLGVSGYAFAFGLSALWLFPACVGGFVLNWFVVAPRLRRASAEDGSLSVTEFLAGRHRGPGFARVRIVASVVLVASLTVYVASQFRGAGVAFETNFETGFDESVLIGAAVVVVYTLLGGFWAVSLTDTLQGLLMALTAIALPVAAVYELGGLGELSGGLGTVASGQQGYNSLWPSGKSLAPLLTIFTLLAIAIGYPGQPHVVNRFMALKDERSMVQAQRIAISWAVIVYAGTLCTGLAARILLDPDGSSYESLKAASKAGESVFYLMMDRLFPEVLGAIMLAAVLSAILSTADSQLLVASTSLGHDLGLKLPGGPVWTSRFVVLFMSLAAVGIAFVDNEKLFNSVLFAWSVVGNAFGPLLLVTLWRGPVRPNHALAALLIGALGSALAYQFRWDFLGVAISRGGILERIAPFALSLLVARAGAVRGLAAKP